MQEGGRIEFFIIVLFLYNEWLLYIMIFSEYCLFWYKDG